MKPSIASRVDRLPLCGFHHRFVTLVSIGGWYDFFDLFMMAYLGAALQSLHFLTLQQFSYLISIGFVGMGIGAVLVGMTSDYLGRRSTFIVAMLIYSAFTVASAFAPSAWVLIILRFAAGIGIGGQQVMVDTYVSEMVPTKARGRYVAISQAVGFSAVPTVAFLSRLLVPTHWLLEGWRWVMIIGGSGAILAWYLMRKLKESPRWLEAHGHHAEAERVMEAIETEVERDTGRPLPAPQPLAVEVMQKMPFRELWQPPYRSRTIMMIAFNLLQTVGFYGFANWAPTYMLRQGRNIGQSLNFGFLFAIMNPFGPLLGVATTERIERKRGLVILALLMAATGMAFAFARGAVMIVIMGATMTVFSSWFSSFFHAYMAELFPTRARATGVGLTYSFSRLSVVISTLVIAALVLHGILTVFAFIAACMVGAAIVVGVWGPRTNAVALEEISQ